MITLSTIIISGLHCIIFEILETNVPRREKDVCVCVSQESDFINCS